MKIYSVGPEEISEYELDYIREFNPEWAIYSYENYGYEGSGFLLMKIDDKYYMHSMGHCSCYGPTSEIELKHPYNNLKEVTAEYRKDDYKFNLLLPLIKKALEIDK